MYNERYNVSNAQVPLIWILFIVIGYTALGGLFLPSWETNWGFWDAAYFSFITMATIGFGDLVPKRETNYWITLPYILLGVFRAHVSL